MAQLVVKWSKKALKKFDDKAIWYLANCGETFVKTFVSDIENTIGTISAMPGIGVEMKQTTQRTYRLYHNHPHCSIYYSYDSKSITVLDIIFTEMAYRP